MFRGVSARSTEFGFAWTPSVYLESNVVAFSHPVWYPGYTPVSCLGH